MVVSIPTSVFRLIDLGKRWFRAVKKCGIDQLKIFAPKFNSETVPLVELGKDQTDTRLLKQGTISLNISWK